MKISKVAVVGLGSMGASVCADLKALSIASEVTGIDTLADSVDYCLSRGFVDVASTDPRDIPPDAEVTVLAVPVDRMREVAAGLFPTLKPGAVVTDIGSVKAGLVDALSSLAPDGVSFVGAHPVAGGEKPGARNASAGIFHRRPVVITDFSPDSQDRAFGIVSGMWKAIGAEVFTMPAVVHDRIFAFVSHLPHLCAYLLSSLAQRSSPEDGSVDPFLLSGGSLRDATRVAMSDPGMWAGILIENSGAVLEAMEKLSSEIDEAALILRTGDRERLGSLLSEGHRAKASRSQKPD